MAEMSDEPDALVQWVHDESLHYVPNDPDLQRFKDFCRGLLVAGKRHLVGDEGNRLALEANRYLQELKYSGSLFPL